MRTVNYHLIEAAYLEYLAGRNHAGQLKLEEVEALLKKLQLQNLDAQNKEE